VAIVSACTQYEIDTGLDVGVDAFLAKPFEPGELVRVVRQLIEQGRARGSGGEDVPAPGDDGLGTGDAERAGRAQG
jgi:DNA-binding response OmpR family regulator